MSIIVMLFCIFNDRKGRYYFHRCLSVHNWPRMPTGSLLGLVTLRSVRILLECFLVIFKIRAIEFVIEDLNLNVLASRYVESALYICVRQRTTTTRRS